MTTTEPGLSRVVRRQRFALVVLAGALVLAIGAGLGARETVPQADPVYVANTQLSPENLDVYTVYVDTITGFGADWASVSVALPEVALDRVIRLEFRFTSDDLQSFAGWYVDDVTVTVP